MNNPQTITGPGQLSVGDKIVITNKEGERQKATVRIVLNAGSNFEEIIFNKSRNYYFITSMLMEGKSWAREVQKIAENTK